MKSKWLVKIGSGETSQFLKQARRENRAQGKSSSRWLAALLVLQHPGDDRGGCRAGTVTDTLPARRSFTLRGPSRMDDLGPRHLYSSSDEECCC